MGAAKSYYETLFEFFDTAHLELPAIEERNQAFWKLLERVAKKHPVKKPSDRPMEILDVACGEFEEARTLASFFSTGTYGVPNKSARIYGIEIEQSKLDRAAVLLQTPTMDDYSHKFVLVPDFLLLCGDARKLDTFTELPKAADLVVIRHHFAAMDREQKNEIWEDIFKASLNALTDEGVLLVTSYVEEEHEIAKEILSELGADVVLQEKNPFAIQHNRERVKDVWWDKLVILAKKSNAK